MPKVRPCELRTEGAALAELGIELGEDGEESKLKKKGIKGDWSVDAGTRLA